MAREIVFLAAILALGYAGKNPLVTRAALVILALYALGLKGYFPLMEEPALQAGLTMLMFAVMLPLVSDQLGIDEIAGAVRRPAGALAVVAGMVAAWLGAKGLPAMAQFPEIVVGLIVGSVVGASLLKGIPTGPLIAAGATYLALRTLRLGG